MAVRICDNRGLTLTRRSDVSRRSISGLGMCLVSAVMGGYALTVHAQSIAVKTLTLPPDVIGIVWDGTRSRFFASSGTSVLMINPETAQIEDTIPVSGQASQIAISDDGQYLYVALENTGMVNRYQVQSHSLDLSIALGQYPGGNVPRDAQALAVLPGHSSTILVATIDGQEIVFDGTVPRAGTAALNVSSLYVRPSDGTIVGYSSASAQVCWLSVSPTGVTAARSAPVDPNWSSGTVIWNGNLVTNKNPFNSSVFDLNAGATIGRIPLPASTGYPNGACALATDSSGTSVITYQYVFQYQGNITNLVQYSLANLSPTASVGFTGLAQDYDSVSSVCNGLVATRARTEYCSAAALRAFPSCTRQV